MSAHAAKVEHQNRPQYFTVASHTLLFYGSPGESELSQHPFGRLPIAMTGRVITHEVGDNGSTIFHLVIEDKKAKSLLDINHFPHQFWAVLTSEVDEGTRRRKWLGGDYSCTQSVELTRRGIEQRKLW